jgi:UDP-glucose 4-epimerase
VGGGRVQEPLLPVYTIMSERILITGCSGYLAQTFIDVCKNDPEVEWLGGIDVRSPRNDDPRVHFFSIDVRSPEIADLLKEQRVTSVVHLAWIFNPTHNPDLERAVDVEGSRNILECIQKAEVPYLVYLSSTTSYGPHPDNPEIFNESYPRRGHRGYLYSKYKAEVDHMMVDFLKQNPQQQMFVARAPIVLGPNTHNVVTQMTELPVLVGVRGFDPPMQFIHEQDLQRLLRWAIQRKPTGIYNVTGPGTIRYGEIMKLLKKPSVWIPASVIYPALSALWSLRLVPFPASILDFVRYPWVGSGEKFLQDYDFRPEFSSKDAFLAYAKARFKNV